MKFVFIPRLQSSLLIDIVYRGKNAIAHLDNGIYKKEVPVAELNEELITSFFSSGHMRDYQVKIQQLVDLLGLLLEPGASKVSSFKSSDFRLNIFSNRKTIYFRYIPLALKRTEFLVKSYRQAIRKIFEMTQVHKYPAFKEFSGVAYLKGNEVLNRKRRNGEESYPRVEAVFSHELYDMYLVKTKT